MSNKTPHVGFFIHHEDAKGTKFMFFRNDSAHKKMEHG